MSGYLDVSAHGHSYLKNELDNTESASFISDLHTKLVVDLQNNSWDVVLI